MKKLLIIVVLAIAGYLYFHVSLVADQGSAGTGASASGGNLAPDLDSVLATPTRTAGATSRFRARAT